MKFSAFFRRGWPLAAQCVVVLGGLTGLYAFPPDHGRMLLLPLTGNAQSGLASAAIAHGAQLIGKGPWPGSFLVEGRRDALALTMLSQGVIVVSAQMGGCGEAA
jgi:hypothetical protein